MGSVIYDFETSNLQSWKRKAMMSLGTITLLSGWSQRIDGDWVTLTFEEQRKLDKVCEENKPKGSYAWKEIGVKEWAR